MPWWQEIPQQEEELHKSSSTWSVSSPGCKLTRQNWMQSMRRSESGLETSDLSQRNSSVDLTLCLGISASWYSELAMLSRTGDPSPAIFALLGAPSLRRLSDHTEGLGDIPAL